MLATTAPNCLGKVVQQLSQPVCLFLTSRWMCFLFSNLFIHYSCIHLNLVLHGSTAFERHRYATLLSIPF